MDWPAWLSEVKTDVTALLRSAATGMVRRWLVSPAVNSVRNSCAALLDTIDDPAEPTPSYAPAGAKPAESPLRPFTLSLQGEPRCTRQAALRPSPRWQVARTSATMIRAALRAICTRTGVMADMGATG
jgi:hypothetical protein